MAVKTSMFANFVFIILLCPGIINAQIMREMILLEIQRHKYLSVWKNVKMKISTLTFLFPY